MLTDQTPPPARRGRPPIPAELRQTERFDMRITQAQRSKLEALGGADWLRERIDKARVTALPPMP